ncbi:MAG: hypothetical protein INR66_18250 [Gordonia polyisoprenivorans]|nr:hypothetical protein [Gordonia polyisoprenivorans]
MSRRQEKARRRRAGVMELDQRYAFRDDRLPLYAAAISMCSCGRIAWVMEDASSDEVAAFHDAERDHEADCLADIEDDAA